MRKMVAVVSGVIAGFALAMLLAEPALAICMGY